MPTATGEGYAEIDFFLANHKFEMVRGQELLVRVPLPNEMYRCGRSG
jgi:hypothetical protein